jgi:hypothetical protein
VEEYELERLRRSVAMLSPGHSAGALTRDQAERLIEDFQQLDDRYRNLITQLRRLLDDLET